MLSEEQIEALSLDIIECLHRQYPNNYERFRNILRILGEYESHIAEAIKILFRLTIDCQYMDDTAKEDLINRIVLRSKSRGVLTSNDYVGIVQTDGVAGIDNSLLRDAIRMDLPLAFRALYYAAGACDAFFSEYAFGFHTPREMINLIRVKSQFSFNNENCYGPGGKLTAITMNRDKACCWVDTFMYRIYLDDPLKQIKPSVLLPGSQSELYNIMPLENIPSVMKHGLLSHNLASAIPHATDEPNHGTQIARANVTLPNGTSLHDHACLYFDARNPMLYKLVRLNSVVRVCVLRISVEVLDLPNVIVSDRNAAANDPYFLPADRVSVLDYEAIHAQRWTDGYYKVAKCAEVLVPNRIESRYILGAYVMNQKDQQELRALVEENKDVSVNHELFFQHPSLT